jgi:hypothetical protein
MQALVTFVIGDTYKRRFTRYSFTNWSNYARRHGYELIVIDQPLDRSAKARSRPIQWQKLLVPGAAALARFRQVAWIDCDIVINWKAAPPIFEGVDETKVGAVDEFLAPDAETYRRSLAVTYLRWRANNVPFFHNLTPQEFYRIRNFPEHAKVVQNGVVVCSPARHCDVFRHVYETYEHNNAPGFLAEMPPLSHELITRGLVQWIDPRFNHQVLINIETDRRRRRLAWEHNDAKAGPLGPTLDRLLAESYFLHFAGCHHLMDQLDLNSHQ